MRDRKTLAAELDRCWEDQWRRAKEICDLLDECFSSAALDAARLRLVVSPSGESELSDSPDRPRPALRALDR